MKRIFAIITLILCVLPLSAQENITKTTFHYATNDNVELYLDRYTSATPSSEPQPAMIFAFGGGFVQGSRDVDFYQPYFRHLPERGIVVV